MLAYGAYMRARLYLESHSKEKKEMEKKEIEIKPGPCITISRQTGAAAGEISELIIEYIKSVSKKPGKEWAVFDKRLIEKVIEDHRLPNDLGEFLTEKKHKFIESLMNELFGIHPSPLSLVKKTSKTILQLAQIGYCIIVGRASNIVLRKMPNTYHVRIIAPFDSRIAEVMKVHEIHSIDEAKKFIKHEDESRAKYVKQFFHKDIEDPSLYDLVINSEFHTREQVAKIIVNSAIIKLKEYFDSVD